MLLRTLQSFWREHVLALTALHELQTYSLATSAAISCQSACEKAEGKQALTALML